MKEFVETFVYFLLASCLLPVSLFNFLFTSCFLPGTLYLLLYLNKSYGAPDYSPIQLYFSQIKPTLFCRFSRFEFNPKIVGEIKHYFTVSGGEPVCDLSSCDKRCRRTQSRPTYLTTVNVICNRAADRKA